VKTNTVILPFDELIEPLTELTVNERNLLRRAYEFANEAHKGQKRQSGEDYFIHCVEVARILIELRMEPAVIAAGLLHDTVEDNVTVTVDMIKEHFGAEIAQLVAGVTKLEGITKLERPDDEGVPFKGRGRDKEAEYLRKTLLAMSDDVRVVLVKLADRLHNMRTLGHMPREKQLRNAHQTMDIFAPLASRLGIWQMKWELEDLSFRYIDPDGYKMIARLIDERRPDREFYVNQVLQKLRGLLAEYGITGQVSGRSKHIYSIWRKMERKSVSFEQIYDVRAVRVLVNDINTCYQVLGIIHQAWRPIQGEFDDYIAAPKDNFYQALHTAVILEEGKTLEVQIRTFDMHEHAEYGVAAHWRYKEPGRQRDDAFERRIKHLRDLMEVGRHMDDANEFLDAMRSDVFQDRVYVFTPRGDIVDLPMGSTPIDFAYHIHTDVGDRCRGAKINGKLVPLDYTLQVGDRVEILTAKRGGPSRDWLSPHLGYVKTKRAAEKVRQWFRKQDREKMITLGREVLERELKRLGVEKVSHDEVAALFGIEKTEDFLAQIGFGDIHPQNIATRVLETDRKAAQQEADLLLATTPSKPASTAGIQIQGTGGLLTAMARCCNPVQGEDIIGYITRGRGVTIHRSDCRNILNTPDPERLITVDWGDGKESRYPVPVVINAYDREGLMRDIGAAVAEERINMRDVNIRTHNHIATFTVTMEVESPAQLSRILTKIERVPNVMEAHRRTT
jgi:GTP diphosphokinase / guanosine-3',5'-bis(diphosphate) 3'-diphosphatase